MSVPSKRVTPSPLAPHKRAGVFLGYPATPGSRQHPELLVPTWFLAVMRMRRVLRVVISSWVMRKDLSVMLGWDGEGPYDGILAQVIWFCRSGGRVLVERTTHGDNSFGLRHRK